MKRHEGLLLKAYWDNIGRVWTIGHGHTGPEVKEGLVISLDQAGEYLDEDITRATEIAKGIFRNYKDLSFVRKTVVVNMAFNLGNRLNKFKRTIGAIEVGDWELASLGMMNSLWYTQVKGRAVELTKRMRTNQIEEKHKIG